MTLFIHTYNSTTLNVRDVVLNEITLRCDVILYVEIYFVFWARGLRTFFLRRLSIFPSVSLYASPLQHLSPTFYYQPRMMSSPEKADLFAPFYKLSLFSGQMERGKMVEREREEGIKMITQIDSIKGEKA